ncbi:MAG: hypothetical protein J6L99_00750 [Ruminococcus sp.]|nr:hypothetical protein [Ruminococcus sp.]
MSKSQFEQKENEDLIGMYQKGLITFEEFKRRLDDETLTYEKLREMSWSDYKGLKKDFPMVYTLLTELDPFNKKK